MSALLEHVMAPEVRPFAIAAAMIVIVGSVEVVSMLVGASLSEMLGTSIDFGHPGDNGIITTWNRGAERLFGYPAREVVGRSIRILVPRSCRIVSYYSW